MHVVKTSEDNIGAQWGRVSLYRRRHAWKFMVLDILWAYWWWTNVLYRVQISCTPPHKKWRWLCSIMQSYMLMKIPPSMPAPSTYATSNKICLHWLLRWELSKHCCTRMSILTDFKNSPWYSTTVSVPAATESKILSDISGANWNQRVELISTGIALLI